MSDELISRETAITALEAWRDGQPDNYNFGAKCDAIDEAIDILTRLPDSPAVSPVPPTAREKIEQRMSDLSDEMRDTEGTGIWAIHTATRNGLQEALNILDGLEWDPEEEAWVRPFPGDPLAAILSAPPFAPSDDQNVFEILRDVWNSPEDEANLAPAPSVGELPETEILLAETPDVEVERYMRESFEGVGELEWRDKRQVEDSHLTWGYIESPGTKFYIWVERDGSVQLDRSNCEDGCEPIAKCASIDEAKELAQRLHEVLESR